MRWALRGALRCDLLWGNGATLPSSWADSIGCSAGTFFLYMQVSRAQTLSDSAPQTIRRVTEQDP